MTPKRQRFVKEYLVDLNASQAAARAGYSADTAGQIGHELLKIPEIAEAIAESMSIRAQETGITARWVLEQAADVYRAARETDRLSEALKALDLCGKHVDVAAFKERIEHTGKDGGPIEIDHVIADADAFTRAVTRLASRSGEASGTGDADPAS